MTGRGWGFLTALLFWGGSAVWPAVPADDALFSSRWRGSPEWGALEAACSRGDAEKVRELSEAQPELARAFRGGRLESLLAWAARRNETNLMQSLLRLGGKTWAASELPPASGALDVAAQAGWPEPIRILLEAGWDPNRLVDSTGRPFALLLSAWGSSGGFDSPSASTPERAVAAAFLLRAGTDLFQAWHSQTAVPIVVGLYSRMPSVTEEILAHARPDAQHSPIGDTLLHVAAACAATNAVVELLARGADPNATNGAGVTPARATVLRPGSEAADPAGSGEPGAGPGIRPLEPALRRLVGSILRDRGARLDALDLAALGDAEGLAARLASSPNEARMRDPRGRTPLHWAALADEAAIIDSLIRLGAEPGLVDADGNTPLHLALDRWPSDAARMLLARGAPLEATNRAGLTPLGAATSLGAVEAVLNAGARVNPPVGEPPLLRAVRAAASRCDPLRNWEMRGQPWTSRLPSPPFEYEVVRRLLRAGADPNARDATGRAPTEFAGDAGALSLYVLLVQYGGSPLGGPQAVEPPWFGLLRRGPRLVRWEEPSWRYRGVQSLPAAAVDLIKRWHLMPRAPLTTNEPVLPYLRSMGLDLAATNRNGGTILHGLAESAGKSAAGGMGGMLFGMDGRAVNGSERAWLPVLEEFRRAGVPPEARDRRGDTAWLAAWRNRAFELAVGLAAFGIDVKATNAAGANALHLLCEPQGSDRGGGWIPGPMVPYLVRLGVDPRARDLAGRTPLHRAVADGCPAYLALDLLDAGADPDTPDSAGVTPRKLVEESTRPDLERAFTARPRRGP